MILRVPVLTRLHVVPVEHTNEATYAVEPNGRRWIAKREEDMGFEALLAEAVSWLLALELGVPVPSAAFCEGQRSWLSEVVEDVAHWSPALGGAVSNADEVGAILALDVLVMNEARHARNLLAQHQGGGSVRVWAIDADEALIGHPAEYGARLDDVPSVRNHARGLPLDRATSGARDAARRATQVSAARVRSVCEAACQVARDPNAALLADLVLDRASRLPDLVAAYLGTLRSLR
jgi:hypothetical protein